MRVSVEGIACPECGGRLVRCFCHGDDETFLGFDRDPCRTVSCAKNSEHRYRLREEGEEGTHADGRLCEGLGYGCRWRGLECNDPERDA